MNLRSFLVVLLVILAASAVLRGVWLTADPPVRRAVGIVWHDEGAWVHNARNAALWDVWRTDEWNPVFVAPVFTALEYAAFELLGVGTWQARIVPALSGLAAIIAIAIALQALAGRRAAVVGAVLLGVNYPFVMWNRAALMESTMTACLVLAWMAWTLAERRPAWGVLAGLAAVAAFFTKAAAAFFIAAFGLELAVAAWIGWQSAPLERRHAMLRVGAGAAGLIGGALLVAAAFVLPWWDEYRFYNWQMSVTRKPSYTLGALVDRATWLPIVQGLFSSMLVELTAGIVACVAILVRWRTAPSAERLLVLWILVGLVELVVHDSGNERRYVMFIPALIALASLLLAARTPPFGVVGARKGLQLLPAALALPLLAYVLAGSFVRPWLTTSIEAGQLSTAVRLSAALAATVTLLLVWRGRAALRWLAGRTVAPAAMKLLVTVAALWHVWQFGTWAATRTFYNHQASIALGRLLEPGTLVQGKLANGMSLENGIRPLFIGNGFGNYDDRLDRDDVRYILTYDLPRIGYESSDGSGLIQGILDHYPGWRVVATFPVEEARGEERAVLIDKFPESFPAHARD